MSLAPRLPLAPYACEATRSRGRLVEEPASPTRSEFQRDRDRVIHSTAFRRLAHKTQVFVPLDGDHFRTRLTHTIEVGQIARALARALALDEDLAEAVALAHDLGHTPFGHAGEGALEACMAAHGGFDHNAQALRVVTLLERRYARYDGLDLCWETLEGLVKHNGPLEGPLAKKPAPRYVAEFDQIFPLELATFAGAEAQAAALADDIAYNAHDIDDGLRAGLFTLVEIAQRSLRCRLAGGDRRAASGFGAPARHSRTRAPGHHALRRGCDREVADAARAGRAQRAPKTCAMRGRRWWRFRPPSPRPIAPSSNFCSRKCIATPRSWGCGRRRAA